MNAAPRPVVKPNVAPLRPPVRAAKPRLRHLALLASFVLLVLAPAAATAFYLWAVAADQYASKVGFSVQREDASGAMDLLGGLASLSGSSSTDTDVLYEFIQSQRLVADINQDLDLRQIWSKPAYDPVFAIDNQGSIEGLRDYWNRMVRISYGTGSGLIEVEVLAFDPVDANRIATAILDRSAAMINELTMIARDDAIKYARADLADAEERLRNAREQLTLFRNRNQIINPELDLQSQAGLLGNLQAQQAEALIEIDLLEGNGQTNDPRLAQARQRLGVIERRIDAERNKLGFGSGATTSEAFANLVGEFERLTIEREFAETSYIAALATFDSALADARRTTRYLAAYLRPTLAETPEYPRRSYLLALVAGFLAMTWAILALIGYSLRDRR